MKWLITIAAVSVVESCGSAPQITATEHGWKTDRVVATRYKGGMLGQNIGFSFPKDPANCDRAEIGDLIAGFGGSIFQGGGYPGAESFAIFEGVKDQATADTKIKAVLPDLTLLMESLDDKDAVNAILARHPIPKYRCKDGESGGSVSPGGIYNGKQYDTFVYVCRDGKMVVDEKTSQWAMDREAKERQEKADLIWAAKTRILTEQEMDRVRSLGTYLVTPLMQSYRQEDVDRQFNDLMLQQFRMRECVKGKR